MRKLSFPLLSLLSLSMLFILRGNASAIPYPEIDLQNVAPKRQSSATRAASSASIIRLGDLVHHEKSYKNQNAVHTAVGVVTKLLANGEAEISFGSDHLNEGWSKTVKIKDLGKSVPYQGGISVGDEIFHPKSGRGKVISVFTNGRAEVKYYRQNIRVDKTFPLIRRLKKWENDSMLSEVDRAVIARIGVLERFRDEKRECIAPHNP